MFEGNRMYYSSPYQVFVFGVGVNLLIVRPVCNRVDRAPSTGPRQAKMCLRACAKCTDSDSSNACAKPNQGISSPSTYSIASNDSVSGQRRS